MELLVVVGVIAVLIAMLLPALRRSVATANQVTCLNKLRQISQAALLYCHDNDGAFPGFAQRVANQNNPCDWIYWDIQGSAPYNDVNRSPVALYLNKPGPNAFRCPADPIETHVNQFHDQPYLFSYCMNMYTSQMHAETASIPWLFTKVAPVSRLQDVINPAQKIFFADEDPRMSNDGTWWNDAPNFDAISGFHDPNRDLYDPQTRGNVAFCDGHADFVTQEYATLQAHYDPKWH